jgi:predicted metal-dependent HD superfamily phosphohydrolase
MDDTAARFVAVWARCGGIDAQAVYDDLVRHYSEPTRHYHTLRHVNRCLHDFDWARPAITDPDAVELALWCHDVVYVPGAPDNEQRSAEWFQRSAKGRIAGSDRVASMILATTHDVALTDPNACFTVDIDLADLGCEREHFLQDEARLRAERPDLDDAGADRAVRAFLSALLAREHIYRTDAFRARCESRARSNLIWRLAQPELG